MVCPAGSGLCRRPWPKNAAALCQPSGRSGDEGYDGSILKTNWMSMLTSIEGRSVIVTGASKGIGKGIARVFAQQGARVLLAARDLSQAEAAATEIPGGSVSAVAADVSKAEDNLRMAETAIQRHGGIG